MKRMKIIALLLLAGCCSFAQDSLTDSSVIVYKFAKFNIILLSQSTRDSVLGKQDRPQKPGSRDRFVTVREPLLKVFLTTNEKPFPHPVKLVLIDAAKSETRSITIDDLEFRSGIVNPDLFTDWKTVAGFPTLERNLSISLAPFIPEDLPVTKGKYYILFERAVTPYTDRILSIRNKSNKEEVLNLTVRVVDSSARPVLAFALQGIANRDLVDSLLTRSSQSISPPRLTEMFNQNKSRNPTIIPDTSDLLKDDSLYNTSELLLYFTRQRSFYPDSSIEYRLISETNNDTSWKKTGHKLTISRLISGNHYQIQVRYELHPALIQNYSFYVVPEWYRGKRFKTLVAGLLIVIALITSLLAYYNHSKKNRRRREQLSLEIRSIRSQLNPHFIFNALSSIQGLINKNDIRAANIYLTSFSTLLRETLRNNEKEMVAVATETELLEVYLRLEQLRFNFRFKIKVDEAINRNAVEIPNLLIQPLVENAVKHGVSTLAETGLIVVEFIKKERDLLIRITDNGNKFDETQTGVGFGLKLTRSRIALLNQTLKEQPINLTLERRDGETIVSLSLKNWI